MAALPQKKMKAVRWEGKALSVSVEEIDVPKIKDPLDAIVRLTSSAICGSDLHIYRGRMYNDHPFTLGHENIGIVEQVGPDVTTIKKGDRVVVTCLEDKPGSNGESIAEGVIGISDKVDLPEFIGREGGQAEFIQVPFADDNLFKVPLGKDLELDYLVLADIFPTAWFALECAGQVIGDTVVVFGAGPVGLLCAYSALLRGATRVYSVDNVPSRLAKAASIGAIPINFDFGPADLQILKLEPNGVDRSCDCCGCECVDEYGNNIENLILNQAVNVTRPGGGIGVIGVYLTHDLGVVQIRLYQSLLLKLIESGKARPSFVFEKEYKIEDAPKAYQEFNEHKVTKAVFRFGKH
ncbi:putative S-glutathione dehydrogenase [Tricladium varicosporioides]|nr:putative S-glutathione dehydrogenase [Hymenoscyphus varicosporioides]